MGKIIQEKQFDLEYFFDLAPDLLCIVGFDGYFKKINTAVSKTLGYTIEELLASPVDTFIHPEDLELTLRNRELIRKGETLYQFENRYIHKNGDIVWLVWTSVPIIRDKLIFAIAKDITRKKLHEDSKRVAEILGKLNTEQMQRFSAELELIRPILTNNDSNLKWLGGQTSVSVSDQLWLNKFEAAVRLYASKLEISLKLLSAEMAMSERQLFRQVKRIMGTTPNKLVLIIRLHLAWEAIASKNHKGLAEVAKIAGYTSKNHFKNVFQQVYGINVSELL